MFDGVKNFVLPDPVLTAIRDAVVDRLAEHLEGRKRTWVLKFHSDGKFRNELNAALERAVYRFAEEYADQPLVDAITRNTAFWTLKSVQEAVKEIVIRPSSYLESEFKILRQAFAEVVPTVQPERIDAAVNSFLHCVSEEVLNIPQLAPIYQVQLQKISVQQGREMVSVLRDLSDIQRKALVALLDVPALQSSLLIDGSNRPEQLKEDKLGELKTRYFTSIMHKYEYMDMGGISPRVTSRAESKIVSIRMEDVFIPLKAQPERSSHGFKSTQMVFINEVGDEDLRVDEKTETIRTHAILQRNQSQGKDDLVGIAKILENEKVVVLGHPGTGKTTIGKYVAYVAATQGSSKLIGEHLSQYIPIIVKAAEYGKFLKSDERLSLYSYLTGKLFSDDYGPLFDWALEKKCCLVIIDGLDEVPDATLRVRVTARIEHFISDHWENRFLVTSRIVGYKGNQLTGGFRHFTLTDLEKEQVIAFLKNWYMAVTEKKGSKDIEKECEKKAKDLWGAIEANEGVKKLAGTPLLLTIIALVNLYGSKLPDRRVELYQLATETLLSNWPLKQREQKIDWKEILAVLEPIAYHIFTTNEDKLITEYEFRPLFEQQVCDYRGTNLKQTRRLSNQLLDKIELHTGFFLKRGTNEHGQEVYGFLHPTFAEYLTARYFAQRWVEEHELEFLGSIHEAAWHEVVLLMAGHLGTLMDVLATRFVEKIETLNSAYEKYLHRDLLLTAEIIGDNVPVSREKRNEIVSRLVSLALETSFMPLYERIMRLLKDIAVAFPFVDPPKQLKPHMNDSIGRRVRKILISRQIGVYKRQAVVETIISGLFGDEDKELTYSSLRLFFDDLNIYPTQNDITHILVVSREFWSFYKVPEQIAEQIIRLRLPILTEDTLVKRSVVPSRDSEQVWLFNIQHLLELLDPLKTASLIGEDQNTIWASYVLIKIISSAKSFPDIFESWLKQAIAEDSKEEDREKLFNLLGFVLNWEPLIEYRRLKASPRITIYKEMLKGFLTTCDKPNFRSIILRVLLSLSPNKEDGEKVAMQGLNDADGEVRANIAREISKFGKRSDDVWHRLRELLIDTSPDVRRVSATSIINSGSFKKEDIPSLLEALPDELTKKTGLNPEAYLPAFARLASKAGASELSKAISSKFIKLLTSIELETTEEWDSYSGYYLGLPDVGKHVLKDLAEAVVPLFYSTDAKLRFLAVALWSSLRRGLGGTASLPPQLEITQILGLLNDNDSRVRLLAIRKLEPIDLDQPDVCKALINTLQSRDISLKVGAIRAFGKKSVSRPDVIDMLLETLKRDVLEVASAAASTLSNVKDSELRRRVADEAGRLIVEQSKSKEAMIILWSLLATTNVR
jgi:hypothetical protein